MTITITVTGTAERLLSALCETTGTTPDEIAREGVATALNGFNYQRVDSRGLMTATGQPKPTAIGPELEPGETERIRELARLAIETALATTNRAALMARMRALWPDGIGRSQRRDEVGRGTYTTRPIPASPPHSLFRRTARRRGATSRGTACVPTERATRGTENANPRDAREQQVLAALPAQRVRDAAYRGLQDERKTSAQQDRGAACTRSARTTVAGPAR